MGMYSANITRDDTKVLIVSLLKQVLKKRRNRNRKLLRAILTDANQLNNGAIEVIIS